MCLVKDIEECAKRVYVYTNDGRQFMSDWFHDDERKNTYGEEVFTLMEREKYDELIQAYGLKEDDVEHWAVNRDKYMDEDCVFISRHAFDRMKERNGWNKKTAMRMIKKIYDEGLSPDQVKGAFAPWVRQRVSKHPDGEFKFYGQNLYVFENKILVTVLPGTKMYKQAVA